jgi:polar amino acid transport system substrate-binding protein
MVAAGQAAAMSGQEFEIGPLLRPLGGLIHSPNPIQRISFYVLFSRKAKHAEDSLRAFNLALARLDRAAQAEADQISPLLTVVTEEFPPYQFMDQGKPTGMTVEVVQAVLAEAGITTPITIVPWTRALKTAQERANVLIFSVARTAERENQFKWIGQVNQSQNYLYARAGSGISIKTLDDAKRYVIGTVLGDIREDYFAKRGFQIQSVRQHELNYARLKAGRIDLWPTTDAVMTHIIRKAGDDPATAVVPVWKIDDLHVGYSGDFLAASLATPDALVERVRAALDQIKSDGRFAAIEHKWVQ